MHIRILGSAAGGGFPQWNCACRNCSELRSGTLKSTPRSQTQLAFSPDGLVWFLLGASPDLRAQIVATPQLAPPATDTTGTPIGGVFLTSADLDAVMGLLHLREFQSFFIFSTPAIQRILKSENPVFDVLHPADPPVQWHTFTPSPPRSSPFRHHLSPPPPFYSTTTSST